jgi:dynein heavy chain
LLSNGSTCTATERLFDLPLTSYPELTEVDNELKILSQIYGLYSAHVDTIRGLSTTLWAELDFKKLTAFTEDFKVGLYKLTHSLKATGFKP